MDKWKGKPFVVWCDDDRDDERTINYHLHVHHWDGTWDEYTFTSGDGVSPTVIDMLLESVIRSIELVDSEWHAELEYYAIP